MSRLETDAEVEQAARATEEREFDTIEAYLKTRKDPLRSDWKALTKQMEGTRAGGVLWLELQKQRAKVLTEIANQFFAGDERKAIFDLIENVK